MVLHETQIMEPWLRRTCYQLKENDEYLTRLDLHGRKIGDVGVEALAAVLRGNTVLKVLILSYNGITEKGARILANLFRYSNMSVTTLNLGGNELGDEGIAALAYGLAWGSSIEVLNLRRNLIGPKGALALSRLLQLHSCSIEKLYVYGNQFGDAGALALGNVLKINQSLRVLFLQENQYGNVGIQHLVGSLQHNYSLRYCLIDESVQEQADYYAKLNRVGRHLLTEHKVPDAIWPHVFAKVRKEPDMLYCLVRSNPALFKRENQERRDGRRRRSSVQRTIGRAMDVLRCRTTMEPESANNRKTGRSCHCPE